jgi:hypothetical protein
MSDPTNQNAGAMPPQDQPAGEAPEAPTQATPPSEEQTQAQAAPAADSAQEPAVAAAATPGGPWYRRRWALITGAVAVAAILFLGGMAVGDALWGQDRPGDFRGDHPGMFRDDGSQGMGQRGWGDNGMVPPGMGRGDDRWDRDGQDRGTGQGHGWGRDGEGYGQRGDRWDRDDCPGDCDDESETTPAPSTSPQALYE